MSDLAIRIRRSLLRWALAAMGERRRRVLAWQAMRSAGVRSVAFEREGLVWEVGINDCAVDVEDYIGFITFVDGSFSRDEIAAVLRWLQHCGLPSTSRNVIVDVGANIGTTSVPMARDGNFRVLAIEPLAGIFELLRRNVAANGLSDRIALVRKAVLGTPRRVPMCINLRNPGSSFVERDGAATTSGDKTSDLEFVEAETLATIVASAGLRPESIALVWADVQGCEGDVIESGVALWADGVPLWAEIEPDSLRRQGSFDGFVALAAQHFDRFIASRDLLRSGIDAPGRPIAELADLIREIIPPQENTDVLFLPPGFRTCRVGDGGGA